LLSCLAPAMGIITCVAESTDRAEPQLIGQFIHTSGSALSHLTFLAPERNLNLASVYPLVERMMALSGERGAMRLLADVDEGSFAFEILRNCGFAIYNRQRIWQLTGQIAAPSKELCWRMSSDQDVIQIRTLYTNLVPGLVQQTEPFSAQRPRGLVLYQKGELLAYVELKYGPRGIWVQPFIHPDAEDIPAYLSDMIANIPARRSRPIYICVRSYQSWLEPGIEDLGGEAGPRQAVMVRQLMVQQKTVRAYTIPALESGQAEVSARLMRLENKRLYVSEENHG